MKSRSIAFGLLTVLATACLGRVPDADLGPDASTVVTSVTPAVAPAQEPAAEVTAYVAPGAQVAPLLSATGLYSDLRAGTLAPGVMEFTPRFRLWADGADKGRWILLPPGTRIDTSNMDQWSFPVGTRLWKEFRVGGVRVETRLIERTGPGPDDFRFSAYRWDADGGEARYVPDGVVDVDGTGHDIPPASQCMECHGRRPERVLGFGAVQLSHDGPGETMATLSARGALTVPRPEGYVVPGDAPTQAAIGYLHANCSHCHNPGGVQFPTPFSMRLLVGQTTLAETSVYRTAVGVPTDEFHQGGVTHRVAPGDVTASCIAHRMGQRGNDQQMPPVATHRVDTEGLATVSAWIASLSPATAPVAR